MIMNQDLKEKWIKALRSGDYKQGKGYLNQNNEKYCCLGVLCNVYGIEWKEIQRVSGFIISGIFGLNDPDELNNLNISRVPLNISNEIGLTDWAQDTLINMNDRINDNLDFTQIADWIEEHL